MPEREPDLLGDVELDPRGVRGLLQGVVLGLDGEERVDPAEREATVLRGLDDLFERLAALAQLADDARVGDRRSWSRRRRTRGIAPALIQRLSVATETPTRSATSSSVVRWATCAWNSSVF